ncbi:MAG: sulfur transferase domain-containing protein [Vicinamibacterales bacterium]
MLLIPLRWLAFTMMVVLLAVPASAQHVVGAGATGPVPDPVVLPNEGRFQVRFARVGEDLFIAGQPTAQALRDLAAEGVTTVVNLRMPQEMQQVGFDEDALARELGLTYVHIPMRGSPENPYDGKALDRFAAALASAKGKVLLHCTVAWRASHLWAAYLIRDRHVPEATALTQARAINLRDDQPFGNQQPIEGFLGRTVPGLARPKP